MNSSLLLRLLTLLFLLPLPIAVGLCPASALAQESTITTPVTDAATRLAEAERLLEQGDQQYKRNQLRAALQSWQQALELYQDPTVQATFPQESVQREGLILSNIGTVYEDLRQYEQALSFYQQSLIIRQELGDRQGEGLTLNNIGSVYGNLGQYEQALSYFQQSLTVRQDIGDRWGAGQTLNNIGVMYRILGQYEQALSFYQQSLTIRQELGDRQGESLTLNNLGSVYGNLGQYEQALSFYQQSLTIRQELGDRWGEGQTLNNLGEVYRALGQYEQAISFYGQSLTISQEMGNRRGEGQTLNNIGNVYRNLGQYEQALDYFQQSLAIRQGIGDRQGEGQTFNNVGVVYRNLGQYEQALDYFQQSLAIRQGIGDRRGEGQTLNNLGNVYFSLGQYERALDYYEQALAIRIEVGDRRGEGANLNNIGEVYRNLGQYEQAFERYQQALTIAQEIGARSVEGVLFSNMGYLLAQQGQPELAIVFYKQSVNVRESIRGELVGLSQELQQSYTDTIADAYRALADLLLQQDRILEAQEVLDLLKLQELQDYELQDVRGTAATRLGLDLWDAEAAILARFFTQLSINPQFDFNTLIASRDIMANVQRLQRNARSQNLNPEQLVRLQDNLRQAGNAALLYPLGLEDRLELVIVTTEGLVRETVPVARGTLNAAIVNFRQAITDRRRSPVAQAQELYQWLMAPIADELEQAGVDTILYAADGQLRYIPLAALHDGEQWLTQRFTINHITAASLTDFSQSGAIDLSILTGAFPEESVEVDLGIEQVWFEGLPFAQQEVENLVSMIPNTTAFFSEAFSRTAIEPRLNAYRIIHLATHAEFHSGHPTDSFILLGDGDRITLFDLDQWQLPDVDLVVLSACKTAVSEELGNGEEILGFGYQVQRTGADAAIASLWYVSDGGTQHLMDGFYIALQNGYPASEALRRAQIALITSDASILAEEQGNTGDAESTALSSGQPLNQRNDLTHPYYWAPFILIGNGL
jgi:CHAT domain-containing protein/Tfp pilus assembly protein PilF